jgi:ABC-type enterochelin transport system ATPase subunit
MIDLFLSWKSNYAKVIELFSQGKSDIMSGVDFSPYIYFDTDRFTELGEDILHMRKVTRDEIKALSKFLDVIVDEDDKKKRDILIADYLIKINKYKPSMKPTSDNYKFHNWMFGDYFSLSTYKTFNKISIEKLSMGQKGTVLLKLFLAEGDYPLLIDQPEENLDNRFIFKELVKAFRQAKKNRQVIIATNNANLVVNTDVEQIIVADFTNGVISYNSGAIEDKKIRSEITEILEGGPEAFKIREKKYNIELY